MRRLLAALTFVAFSLAGCAGRRPGDPLKPSSFNIYSPEQDIEIGRQAAAQVKRQLPVYQNPAVQSYVRLLGSKLAATPSAGRYPYSFTVVREPSINAFALPGGPLFVHSGLLAAADNEAQLAGVLAHEIAHVVLRHGTSQASKANLLQIPAAIAGATMGNAAGGLGQLGLSVALESVLLKYSRSAESEADALGAHIMAEAGYNPVEMAHFFEKLESGGGPRAPQFLSDHPSPGNRVQAVNAEIMRLPRRPYTANTGRFQSIQRQVARR